MKKLFIFFVGILLLACFNPVSGQLPWVAIGPQGGTVRSIQATSTHLFSIVEVNGSYTSGIWRSNDNGSTWDNISGNLQNQRVSRLWTSNDTIFLSLAATNNGGTIYDDGGIFRSTDNGETWTRILTTTTNTRNSYLRTDTALFFGGSGGVSRSYDNGLTWQLKNGGQNALNSFVISLESINDTIFIGTKNGIFRSTNNCDTWVVADAGIPGSGNHDWITEMATVGSTIYAASLADGVYKSTNYGTSWVPVINGLTNLKAESLYAVDSTLYVGTYYGGVFKSVDGGANWIPANQGLSNETVYCFYQHENMLFSGGMDGVYMTTDSGANWTNSNNGLNGHSVITFAGAGIDNTGSSGNNLFIGTRSGRIYHSDDNSATWEPSNGIIKTQLATTPIAAMVCKDSLIFVSADCLNTTGFFKSADWGNTWVEIPHPGFGGIAAEMLVINNRIFFKQDNFLYFSDDDGISWQSILPTNIASYGILTKKGNELFVVGYEQSYSLYNNIYKLNQDLVFEFVGEIAAFDWTTSLGASGDTLFASGYHNNGTTISPLGIYKSGDNGASWTYDGLLSKEINKIYTSEENIVFASMKYGIFVKNSVNGSWQEISNGLPLLIDGPSIFSISSNDGKLFVGISGKSLYAIDLSYLTFIPPSQPSAIIGSVSPCIGSTETYSVTNVSGVTYTWQFPADWTILGGAGTNEVTVEVGAQSGVIIVTPSNFFGTGPSQTLLVTPVPVVPADVSITADNNPSCPGFDVTFTAIPVNGGNPFYEWYVNGLSVGTNQATYSYIPDNNDQVYVVMTSDLSCTSDNPATSNTISMVMSDLNPVSVSITADQNNVCEGTQVIFTATPVNGGNPSYQWYANGNTAGSDQDTFSYTPADGDQVYVVMTSDLGCVSDNPATSNTISMLVNDLLPVNASIVADQNDVCDGTQVTFTATPVNGGNPSYQWYVNGSTVGSDQDTFTYTPADGDQVYVVMTSDLSCVSDNPATSNTVTLIVNDILPVSVSIVADQNNVCEGTIVSFFPIPVEGGSSPTYEWYVNGNFAANGDTYSYVPSDGDQVYVIMTSSLACVSGNPAQSNTFLMQVSPYIDVTASIAITQNNLCEGSEFNFTSSTTGGGNTPQYQWQVNGATTGENTPEFAYVAENGDVVSMVFTSDLTCTNGNPVTSNTITAVANPLPVVTWPGFEPDTLCIEDWGPVTLTGGTPEGGTYSGDGVVDNIFDPTLAGTGTHEITYTYSDPSGCSNQSSLFLFVDVCLGMSEKESGLLVYPNPVSDNLMVKMQDNSTLQQITLTNMLGIRVYQIENPDSNEVVSIPVQNLPSGNYLLRVISESKFAFKMVVIK